MASTTGTPKSGVFYGWFVLVGALVISGIGYSMRYSFGMFMPHLLGEFGWSRGDAALASSISILVYGLTSPLVGWGTDKFGPKKMLTFGAITLAAGMLLASTMSSLWMLYLSFGVVAAIGINSLGFAVHNAYVPNWFIRKRGLAFGIVMAGSGLGNVIVGGYQPLIAAMGWRGAFMALAAIAVIVVIPIVLFVIKKSPQEKGQLPDGLKEAPGPEAAAARQKMMAALIVDKEWTAIEWTLGRAMKTSRLWFMFLWFACLSFSLNMIMIHQPIHTTGLGFPPGMAAGLFSLMGLSMFAGQLGLGFVSDRLGREMTYTLFSVVILAGIAAIWAAGPETGWMLYAWAILFGGGLGAGSPVGFAGLADMFFGRSYGAINGFCLLGFGIGGFLGPWFGGKIYDAQGSYTMAFVVTAIVIVVSVAMIWLSGPGKVRLTPGRAPKG